LEPEGLGGGDVNCMRLRQWCGKERMWLLVYIISSGVQI
jgi:hypothetical protein